MAAARSERMFRHTDAHADAVRAFVDVQEVADAVPCTVAADILSS